MKYLVALLALLFVPSLASAAIARDGSVTEASGTGSFTYSKTVSTTGDVLLVSIVDTSSNGLDKVSAVSWNGSAMTRVAAILSGCTNNPPVFLYKLNNATAGTGNVSITGVTSIGFSSVAVAYSGVDTTNAIDTFSSACDNNAPTPSLTSTVAGDWYVAALGVWFAYPTAIAGATRLDATNVQGEIWDSGASVGSAGIHSFAYTAATNSEIAHFDVLLKPIASAAVTPTALPQVYGWY